MTYQLPLDNELIVDNFAGGGGASCGIERALQRPVNIAINHDAEALGMHEANHPLTTHYCESVWDVDPRRLCNGRPVALAWFSPDCKHFSKAKGSKPVEKNIRGLAWVALRWVGTVRPRVVILENVEEFVTWGPLRRMRDEDGTVLLHDDGRPQMEPCPNRRGVTFRAFVNAFRRQGYKVEWKELRACDYGAPTIRKRLFLIARCDDRPIVWPQATHGPPGSGLPPYRTAAECIDWSIACPSIFDRERPLVENTMRRIAWGVKKFVLDNPKPFILNLTHGGRVEPANEPLRTITAAKRGEKAIVSPTLIQTGYGEREGQAPRVPGLDKPLGTCVAGGNKHALVAAFLAKHFGGVIGADVRLPLPTILTKAAQTQIVTSNLVKLRGTNIGSATDEPLHTVSAGGTHHAEVRAFLIKYFGTDQDPRLEEPLHTVTTKHRFGIVTVHGQDWIIADIGMRMLIPRELYRAQGFPESYIIDRRSDGTPLIKTAQIRMCGNSVCPPVAEAIVRANVLPSAVFTEARHAA